MNAQGRPHSDGVDSSNPCRWRGERLHHHGDGVCWLFVLLWMDSWCHKLIVCKKLYKNNLKMRLTRYFLIHVGVHHTHWWTLEVVCNFFLQLGELCHKFVISGVESLVWDFCYRRFVRFRRFDSPSLGEILWSSSTTAPPGSLPSCGLLAHPCILALLSPLALVC